MVEYVVRYAGERINDFADLAILGGSCHLEAGAFGTLTLELPPSHPMARMGAFAKRDASREVTFSERYADGTEAELFRGWVTDSSLDADLVLTVECEGMLSYLERTCVRPYSATALTGLSAGTTVINSDPFEWIVEQHNLHAGRDMAFEVGVNPHARVAAGSEDYPTTWDELNGKFCTGLDRFLHARSNEWGVRVLDLLDGGAGEGTQAIVVGENVVEMALDESSRDVVTAIIPRGTTDDEYHAGAGERIERRDIGVEGADVGPMVGDCSTATVEGDRVVNWDMVAAYGMREERRDYDATTPEDLARMAAAELNPAELGEREVRAFDVTALDLHDLNPSMQPLRLLDWTEIFIRADGQVDGDAKGRLVFHGWLPCTTIDFDLADPARSRYHFGDLPQTLTRQSALRLGMLRRGNGTLVRKAGATEWNNDRVWNRSDEVEDGYIAGDEEVRGELAGAEERWSEHLDEQFDAHTKEWYEHLESSVGEVAAQDAQGREDLLKHLDEVEGKWSDDLGALDSELSDAIDGVSGRVDGLQGTVDANHRTLLEGIRDVAQNAQRTFFGECRSYGSARTVSGANLTRPGGEEFALAKGVVVDVLMQYASSGACTLDIAGTGAIGVCTNGFDVGVWQAGQVVRMLYDGTCWQACSTDIYGSSITVGNPAQANFYTNGYDAQLRIGSDAYWKASMTGQTVGLTSQSHIDIGDSYIDMVHRSGATLTFSYDSSYDTASIKSDSGVDIDGGYGYVILGNNYGGFYVPSTYDGPTMTNRSGSKSLSFSLGGDGFQTNQYRWVTRSIVVTASDQEYMSFTPARLGLNTFDGYAFAVSNGDANARDFYVVGTQVTPTWMAVKFDRAVNNNIRLNFLGVPVGTIYKD